MPNEHIIIIILIFIMLACSACCFVSLSGFTPLRCCPCPGLPRCSVFLVRVCPALGPFSLSKFTPLRVCLVRVFAVAMFSLSGATLLLCFFLSGFTLPLLRVPCPGLPRCDAFLVWVYPVALLFLVRVYPAVAPFSLSGFIPLRCFPCPGLPRF